MASTVQLRKAINKHMNKTIMQLVAKSNKQNVHLLNIHLQRTIKTILILMCSHHPNYTRDALKLMEINWKKEQLNMIHLQVMRGLDLTTYQATKVQTTS
jgi:hypothetical protein